MPWWQWAADAVGVTLLLLLLWCLGLLLRRRWLSRRRGTFELSLRARPAGGPRGRVTGGWVLGLGRYSGNDLQFYRIFSLSPRPLQVLRRDQLEYAGQRPPTRGESQLLYSGHVIIACVDGDGAVELALSPEALTGFVAWLEAAPPGRTTRVY